MSCSPPPRALSRHRHSPKQTLVCGCSPHFPRWSNGTLVCEAAIRETSCRPVRSEDETLAGAPLWSLMLTFLSRSAREIALGEVLPGGRGGEPPSVWA